MKKAFIAIAIAVVAGAAAMVLSGVRINKIIFINSLVRIDELVAWVDKKYSSGYLYKPKKGFGSYMFIGAYDVDIDFDPGRYGLEPAAVARVDVDGDGKPVAVVFFDNSYCGIAIATRASADANEAFIRLPSDIRMRSARVGTFCIKRD